MAALAPTVGLGAPALGGSIEIPVKDSDEVVEVMLDELPNDAHEIVDILRAEAAPLNLWLRFALEYYRRGKAAACEVMLAEAASPKVLALFARPNRTDRIAILNALAALYIQQATQETSSLGRALFQDVAKRSDLFALATTKLNEAEGLDDQARSTWLGKGLLRLAKGDDENAIYQFNAVLKEYKDDVPALLGMANIEYNNKNYKSALRRYKQALRVLPSNMPALRLGIALCYHQLGFEDKARSAYDRVLQLDPHNVAALSGLAVLDLAAGETASALQRLRKAYELNRTQPAVLNILARFMVQKGDYDKAESLAMNAFHFSAVDAVKAESCLQVARVHHAKENYEEAFAYYYQAVKLNPNLLLAQFGLAQMYIHRGQPTEAAECLEKVLEKYPENYETLKMLGSLYRRIPAKRAQSVDMLKRVTALRPDDIEAWVELAEQLEGSDPAKALEAYQAAWELHKGLAHTEAPPELINNVAVLRHRLGQHDQASDLYRQADDACAAAMATAPDAERDALAALRMTIKFNAARLLEDAGKPDEAAAAYRAHIAAHPAYVEARLALAQLLLRRRETAEAQELCMDVLAIDQDNADAWSLLASMHAARGDLRAARKTYEHILTKTEATESTAPNAAGSIGGKRDLYALVALGNLHHRLAKQHSAKPASDAEFKQAAQFYAHALVIDPHNAFAANGMGVLLAEKGHYLQARETFVQVRDNVPDSLDVWVNLAHANLELGVFASAIKLYEGALKRLHGWQSAPGTFRSTNDGQEFILQLYLAHAHYVQGVAEKDERSLALAEQYLEKAIHLRPWDHALHFNLGLVKQDRANLLIEDARARQSRDKAEQGLEEARQATRLFKWLRDAEPYPRQAYDPAMAAERCRHLEKVLLPMAERTAQEQAKRAQQLEESAQSLDEKRRQELLEKQREEEEARQRQAELDRQLAEARREEGLRIQKEFQEVVAQEKSKGGSGEGKRPAWQGQRGRRPKASEILKKAGGDGAEGDETDAEKGEKPAKRRGRPRKAKPADEAAGEEGQPKKKRAAAGTPRQRSRRKGRKGKYEEEDDENDEESSSDSSEEEEEEEEEEDEDEEESAPESGAVQGDAGDVDVEGSGGEAAAEGTERRRRGRSGKAAAGGKPSKRTKRADKAAAAPEAAPSSTRKRLSRRSQADRDSDAGGGGSSSEGEGAAAGAAGASSARRKQRKVVSDEEDDDDAPAKSQPRGRKRNARAMGSDIDSDDE